MRVAKEDSGWKLSRNYRVLQVLGRQYPPRIICLKNQARGWSGPVLEQASNDVLKSKRVGYLINLANRTRPPYRVIVWWTLRIRKTRANSMSVTAAPSKWTEHGDIPPLAWKSIATSPTSGGSAKAALARRIFRLRKIVEHLAGNNRKRRRRHFPRVTVELESSVIIYMTFPGPDCNWFNFPIIPYVLLYYRCDIHNIRYVITYGGVSEDYSSVFCSRVRKSVRGMSYVHPFVKYTALLGLRDR